MLTQFTLEELFKVVVTKLIDLFCVKIVTSEHSVHACAGVHQLRKDNTRGQSSERILVLK